MATLAEKAFSPVSSDTVSETNGWFERTIHDLETDKMLYNTSAMSAETAKFYEDVAKGEIKDIVDNLILKAHIFYVKVMLKDFLARIYDYKKSLPNVIAFDHKDREIMAWIEVEDDDESFMDHIFLAEARVNNKNKEVGYSISATIVENSDRLFKPAHYREIDQNK